MIPDLTKPNKTASKWGGFLKDIDDLILYFFDISPAEAEFIGSPTAIIFRRILEEFLKSQAILLKR